MSAYLLRRSLSTLPVIFVSTFLVFVICKVIPGDPVYSLLPPAPTPEQISETRARYGLDRPFHEQYFIWLSNAIQGELGLSIANGWPVSKLLRTKMMVTVQLAIAGFALALVVALPLGIRAGLRPEGWTAKFMAFYTTLGFAVPGFYSGMLLILLFGVLLGWLPTSGFKSLFEDPLGAVKYMALPAFTLSIGNSVVLANFLQASVTQVSAAEYVTAAIAKGLPRRTVIGKHILRNALIPLVTVGMLQLGYLFAGTVITESLFGIPGLGRLLVDAIYARDYPVLQGALLLIVGVVITLNLLTDLLYGWLDPRVRLN